MIYRTAGWALLVGWLAGSTCWAQPPEPGPEYRILKKDVGRWIAKMKMWEGPGDPIEAEGTEINRMVGPYFVVSDFKVELNGQPFAGHGVFGYDAEKKKYVGSWIDSMSPIAMHMVGEYDRATKTMTYVGETVAPDGSKVKFKNVTVYNDDGSRTMTMYMGSADSEELPKAMEIHYTRQPRKKARDQAPDGQPAAVVD